MLCPHCNLGFFDDWSGPEVLVHHDERATGLSYTACPNCHRLTVRLVEGPYDEDEDDFECDEHDKPEIDEVTVIYPAATGPQFSEEVPEPFRDDFAEITRTVSGSARAAAALGRRLLQAVLDQGLHIHSTNLSKQIDILLSKEGIPSHIAKSVDAVRQIGNFAAHPSKETNTGEIADVEVGEAEWILETLAWLLDFVYIQPKRIEKRRHALNNKLETLGKDKLKG
jgi:Domain of unknown function (DUF4145)